MQREFLPLYVTSRLLLKIYFTSYLHASKFEFGIYICLLHVLQVCVSTKFCILMLPTQQKRNNMNFTNDPITYKAYMQLLLIKCFHLNFPEIRRFALIHINNPSYTGAFFSEYYMFSFRQNHYCSPKLAIYAPAILYG